ncbi:MAG: hypothetical protein Q6367_010545 [Candidatus Freyarchaeota archaeon]
MGSSIVSGDKADVESLFIQFLQENERYYKLFMQYDEINRVQNDLKMQEEIEKIEQAFKNIDIVIAKGDLVREWNITNSVNGTEFTYINREYSLNLNGTEISVLKVMIYASDGTTIVDPKVYLHFFPLYFWLWWYGLWYYGQDEYLYIHYDTQEAPWFIYDLQNQWQEIDKWITIIVLTLCWPLGYAVGAVIGSSTWAVILSNLAGYATGLASYFLLGNIATQIVQTFEYAFMQNPAWGLRVLHRQHWIWFGRAPWYDPISWIEYHVVYESGVHYNALHIAIPQTIMADTFHNWFWTIGGACGFDRWIWVGPYIPGQWPPPFS